MSGYIYLTIKLFNNKKTLSNIKNILKTLSTIKKKKTYLTIMLFNIEKSHDIQYNNIKFSQEILMHQKYYFLNDERAKWYIYHCATIVLNKTENLVLIESGIFFLFK